MKDFMYIADTKAIWRDFAIAQGFATAEPAPGNPEQLVMVYKPGFIVDVIGAVMVTPPVYDNSTTPPTLISEAVMDNRFHLNIRITDDYVPIVLARGDGINPPVGPGVIWVDPAAVATPVRVWLGGMDYYVP